MTHPHAQSRAHIAKTYAQNKLRQARRDKECSTIALNPVCASEQAGLVCGFLFAASIKPRVAEYLQSINAEVRAQALYLRALSACATAGVGHE